VIGKVTSNIKELALPELKQKFDPKLNKIVLIM